MLCDPITYSLPRRNTILSRSRLGLFRFFHLPIRLDSTLPRQLATSQTCVCPYRAGLTKRDLKRTKLAEQTARERKAQKNTPLQVGGVLTVEQGREMVVTTETLHDARINPRNNKP